MKKKLISILITNFNKDKFLKKTLSSIVNQNFKNYEIILFDDASTDNSLAIIKKFKKVKLIKNLNAHSSKSPPLNQVKGIIEAFKLSKGNIVCLLDSDDIFTKNKLKRIHSYFKINVNKKFVVNLPLSKKNFYLKKINPNASVWPTIFPTSCISFKRNFFDNYLRFIKKNNFKNLEIDSRLIMYAHHYCDDFNIIDEKLTKYVDDEKGISSKYKKFSLNWWLKRYEAFQYLMFILRKKKKNFIYSFDYYLTGIINFLIRIFIR
jgi:glycosyltransferase involved in cell wall biosynthesis